MKKALKTSLVALGLLAFGFAITSKVNALPETADVNLTVNEGVLTIGVSGATLNLGAVNSTNSEQVLSGQFPIDSFYVSDLKGAANGYSTTISVTDLTGDVDGVTKTIPAANVSFKAGQAAPHLITGDANTGVVFDDNVADYHVISSVVTYIKRTGNGGILGEYGDAPWVKVTIPAYTPATTYHGTITYTLIDND